VTKNKSLIYKLFVATVCIQTQGCSYVLQNYITNKTSSEITADVVYETDAKELHVDDTIKIKPGVSCKVSTLPYSGNVFVISSKYISKTYVALSEKTSFVISIEEFHDGDAINISVADDKYQKTFDDDTLTYCR